MKRLSSFLLTVVCVVALASSSFAINVPPLKGWVNDNANLLTQTDRNTLTTALKSLQERTTVQVRVLTVPDLQNVDIKTFGIEVATAWKLGQEKEDNGLLILYAVKEDKYRLEVGYGLEGAIPDGKAGTIIRTEMRTKADPKKGTSDFGGAFRGAVKSIGSIVDAEYAKDPTGKSMRGNAGDQIGLLVIVAMAVLIAGICGFMNVIAGGVVGALEGAGIATFFGVVMPSLIVFIVVGFLVGLIAKFILEAVLEGGGGGGGGYGYSSGGGGSSSSSGGFSGGGGGFGGGGADG